MTRAVWLENTKLLLVHCVLLGHALRFFEVNSFGLQLFYQKMNPLINQALLFGHMVVIPLLFMASGASLCYSLSSLPPAIATKSSGMLIFMPHYALLVKFSGIL